MTWMSDDRIFLATCSDACIIRLGIERRIDLAVSGIGSTRLSAEFLSIDVASSIVLATVADADQRILTRM